MKVFCKEFITVWTRGLVRWLSRKFDSISIDLTPVEDKLDAIDGKIGTPAEGQPTTLFGAIAAGGSGGGEDAHNLAQFFGVTLLEGYEFMTDTEVCGELEDIMQLVDPDLTAEQAAAITAQTLNPSES
jgi:hypothetical protein